MPARADACKTRIVWYADGMNKVADTLVTELETFSPEEQTRLGNDFVAYLRRLRDLRLELAKGERDIAEGKVGNLADLDSAIAALRRQHAGA